MCFISSTRTTCKVIDIITWKRRKYSHLFFASVELFTLNMISCPRSYFWQILHFPLITGRCGRRGGLTEWDWEILRGLEGGEILLQFWLILGCNNRFTRTGEHLNQTYSVYLSTLRRCHKTGGGEAKENIFLTNRKRIAPLTPLHVWTLGVCLCLLYFWLYRCCVF